MSKSRLVSMTIPLLFAVLACAQQNPVPLLGARPSPVATPEKTEGRIHLDVVVTDKS